MEMKELCHCDPPQKKKYFEHKNYFEFLKFPIILKVEPPKNLMGRNHLLGSYQEICLLSLEMSKPHITPKKILSQTVSPIYSPKGPFILP